MALIAKKTGGGGKYDLGPLAPNGMHRAVCVDIIDLGMQTTTFEGKTRERHMVLMIWQLDKRDTSTNKRYLAGKRYNLSLNEAATLRKDLESWRGKAFTPAEEEGFDVNKVIGANCQVIVQQVTKSTGTYANVLTVAPRAPGQALAAENYKPVVVEESDSDDSDDPFAQDPAGLASVGGTTPPVPVTADDIPF